MNNKEENKHEKFRRIANIRTKNVLKSLRSLSKLSNPRSYEYSRHDVLTIFSRISGEVRVARALFDKNHMDIDDDVL